MPFFLFQKYPYQSILIVDRILKWHTLAAIFKQGGFDKW